MKFPSHQYLFVLFLLFLSYSCSSNLRSTVSTESDLTPIITEPFQGKNWDQATDTLTSQPIIEPPTPTATTLPPIDTQQATETSTPSYIPKPSETPIPSSTKLLFTGAIVPGRCVQAAIDERGNADFLYAGVQDLILEADIAVGTLNAALSDYPPHRGCIKTLVLVGSSDNADAMARAGFDVMSVATNHIKNCGPSNCGHRAFFDTLDNLERVGIQPVGAGKDIHQAMQPVVVEKNGIRFGFISLGEIEAMTFASEDSPGIAPLTQDIDAAAENLQAAIYAARDIADVVIAMPHWGSEYSHTPNYRQLSFDQVAVQAGADLVIGNHPHVIQGMQEIAGIPVFYSLGNFIFDQDWSLETQQGIVVVVTFQGSEFSSFEVIPVHIDSDGFVRVAESPEYEEIMKRFQDLSEDLK